jgi:hypothetical protein
LISNFAESSLLSVVLAVKVVVSMLGIEGKKRIPARVEKSI